MKVIEKYLIVSVVNSQEQKFARLIESKTSIYLINFSYQFNKMIIITN